MDFAGNSEAGHFVDNPDNSSNDDDRQTNSDRNDDTEV